MTETYNELVLPMSEPSNRSRPEHWASLGLTELPQEEYEIQRPKPRSKEILDILQVVLDEKEATSMEKARLLSKITLKVTRRSGRMKEEVEVLMHNCHKYTEAHLNGNLIKKARDVEGNVWVWLQKGVGLKGEAMHFNSLDGTSSVVWMTWPLTVQEQQPLTWFRARNEPSVDYL